MDEHFKKTVYHSYPDRLSVKATHINSDNKIIQLIFNVDRIDLLEQTSPVDDAPRSYITLINGTKILTCLTTDELYNRIYHNPLGGNVIDLTPFTGIPVDAKTMRDLRRKFNAVAPDSAMTIRIPAYEGQQLDGEPFIVEISENDLRYFETNKKYPTTSTFFSYEKAPGQRNSFFTNFSVDDFCEQVENALTVLPRALPTSSIKTTKL